MSDFITAASELQSMLNKFKSVETVVSALNRIGSIENAGKEAEEKLASLKGLIESASKDLDNAVSVVAETKDQAKKIASDAKNKADAKVAKAEEDAASIIASASAKSAIAENNVSKLNEELAEKTNALGSLKEEFSDLEAKIAKAKNYLSKLAGA